ncbi:hypothetical protein [Candidatus Nitrosocosmicus oleophilus]|nr:hypothetical protein [Candidatus Nitrosocosmicus oleophilus]
MEILSFLKGGIRIILYPCNFDEGSLNDKASHYVECKTFEEVMVAVA